MTTNEMISELTETVKHLQKDVEILKKDKDYLYNKLEKAYDDRIQLRAENSRLKKPAIIKAMEVSNEEEECLACSA